MLSGIVSAILAAGVMAVSVVPANAETTHETGFVKGQTVVTLDPGAAFALRFFKVQLDTLRPATAAAPAYTFPVFGNPYDGTTELAGGLRFTANDKCFAAYAPVVNTKAGVVKAWVNGGARIELFKIDGAKLVLTEAGAKGLNDALGFTGLFTAGFVFGTYQTTLN
ncbi:hypothetical protein DMH04_54525 [Kibdelosporangium aridum]|uniref:Uncharacterized protein n=1 Tax=Kibdelosporangium aridum TaxID=2030 RepID=A0A428XY05_KIBAR|nr:hypothetical protein DMH04_54525 [Kibdelosporangium aridum]